MKKLSKKIIFACLALIFSLSYGAPSAYAWDLVNLSSGNVMDITELMMETATEEYLGIEKSELDYQINNLNVSRQKKNPPQVSIIFSPLNPSTGEKVTATATPSYFMNDTKDLYFTWYLKNKNCPKTSRSDYNDLSTDQKRRCDLDNDRDIDIEDYKIRAARIIVSNDFEWNANPDPYTENTDQDSYIAVSGGDDQKGKDAQCFVHDTKSGDEYSIDCGHLFPEAPDHDTADGSFGADEEQFWRTDPRNDDTADLGNKDEANVAGLGVSSFAWMYEAGDQVGVVVEGVSVEPTQTADASYKTMWALLNNRCDINASVDYPKTSTETISVTEDDPEAGQTTTVTETTVQEIDNDDQAGNIATIKTTVTTTTTITDSVIEEVLSKTETSADPTYETIDISEDISKDIDEASDLNDCLYSNLIDPAEEGATGKLEVELTYSPDSPVNDPTPHDDPALSEGDDLVVQSSVINVAKPERLTYLWEVFSEEEINPIDGWGNALLKSELPGSSQTYGLGLDSFNFKLNFENPPKYFKVKLTVTERLSEDKTRKGSASVIIPIYSTSERIKVFNASLNDDLLMSLGNEICVDGRDQALCPVSKNQILGVFVASESLPGCEGSNCNWLWTIDGEPFTYQECFFENCNASVGNNVAYFPILKENEEKYTVNLSALNQTTGEKIELTRMLEVTDPKIRISPTEESESTCGPVLLGHYMDTDGTPWPDYSSQNFWALTDYPIKLRADAVGFSNPIDTYSWNWSVDNVPLDSSSYFGTLSLDPKPDGENYSVAASVLYTQSDKIKKALNKYWSVTYDQFYEKPVSASIDIEMRTFAPSGIAQAPSKKILANIYSSVPEYLAFLLRIVLTAFIIIFGSSFLLSLFPNLNKNEK